MGLASTWLSIRITVLGGVPFPGVKRFPEITKLFKHLSPAVYQTLGFLTQHDSTPDSDKCVLQVLQVQDTQVCQIRVPGAAVVER